MRLLEELKKIILRAAFYSENEIKCNPFPLSMLDTTCAFLRIELCVAHFIFPSPFRAQLEALNPDITALQASHTTDQVRVMVLKRERI